MIERFIFGGACRTIFHSFAGGIVPDYLAAGMRLARKSVTLSPRD
jgi:hypothetical protein